VATAKDAGRRGLVTLNSVVSQFSFINGLEGAAAKKASIQQTSELDARLAEAGNSLEGAVDRRSRFRMAGSAQ
jgi:hypothetical protein